MLCWTRLCGRLGILDFPVPDAESIALRAADLGSIGMLSGAAKRWRLPERWRLVRVQIKQMTDRDLARLWSQYVKELAVLLVLAEGPHPPPEVVERMQELVQRELLLLYIRYGNHRLHALQVSSRPSTPVADGAACSLRCSAQKLMPLLYIRGNSCNFWPNPLSPGALLASASVDGVRNVLQELPTGGDITVLHGSRAALTNMSNVKRFIARYKVEEMRMPLGDDGVGMWRTVAQALQLSPSQASETTKLWRSFRSANLLPLPCQGAEFVGQQSSWMRQ